MAIKLNKNLNKTSGLLCYPFQNRMFKAPFKLQKILGTARMKVVRVPKKIVLISHLHVLSSAVLNNVKLCLVRVKGSTSWPAYSILA